VKQIHLFFRLLSVAHGINVPFCECILPNIKIKEEADIIKEIHSTAKVLPGVRKIFLADGNPMVLTTKKLWSSLPPFMKLFQSQEGIYLRITEEIFYQNHWKN